LAERLSSAPVVKGIKDVLARWLPRLSPRLVIVYSSQFPDAVSYAHSQLLQMESVGVNVRLIDVDGWSFRKVLDVVEGEVRAGSYVSVLRPLPEDIDYHRILDVVPPHQDAEGVTWRTLAGLVAGDFRFGLPLTPWSAVLLPLAYGYCYEGKRAVVFGRSPTVGMPLAVILARLMPPLPCFTPRADLHRISAVLPILSL